MPTGSSQPTQHILVVEDEASIRQGLCDVFRFRGCAVEGVERGDEGLARALADNWDLLVLDIMLPQLDGFQVCERIRETGRQFPILILTAKGDENDIVRGFEVGANDYVTKPFGVRELVARANALLRRSPRSLPRVFQAGAIEVNADLNLALFRHKQIQLSGREVLLLRVLSKDQGRIVSRRTLLELVWGMNNVERIETRTVDVHIANLRKKLGGGGRIIETVRGQGYRLCR